MDNTTYPGCGHRYAFERPRTVSIKGKGETAVYRLTGKLHSG